MATFWIGTAHRHLSALSVKALSGGCLARCLERGVSRCVVMAPTEDIGDQQHFLEHYETLRARLG